MELLSSGNFWTIVTVAVSALGVHFAARADRRKERQEAERRREAGEKRLAEQISNLRRELMGAFADHKQEVTGALADHKQEVTGALADHRQEMKEALADHKQEMTGALAGHRQEMTEALADHKQEVTGALAGHRQEMKEALAGHRQEIGRRIDRLEDRVDENHREVTAALAELRAEVSALSTKVDERSFPRRFEGGGLPGTEAAAAPGVGVREAPTRYSADEPKGEADGTPGQPASP